MRRVSGNSYPGGTGRREAPSWVSSKQFRTSCTFLDSVLISSRRRPRLLVGPEAVCRVFGARTQEQHGKSQLTSQSPGLRCPPEGPGSPAGLALSCRSARLPVDGALTPFLALQSTVLRSLPGTCPPVPPSFQNDRGALAFSQQELLLHCPNRHCCDAC